MRYEDFQFIKFERHSDGVLLAILNRPEVMNATNGRLHYELANMWGVVDADDTVKSIVVTGAGDRAFSAGGDLEWVAGLVGNPDAVAETMKEVSDLVYNVINCQKPIISAINGAAVGAGLAVAILADISIIADDAKITDGHVRLGVAAGDHAAIVWPLLCGLAKAKYYLMLCEPVSGEEAERIGLVSLAVDDDQLLPKAYEIADRLAAGSQSAIRWTKYSLNNWLRQAGPSFDTSLALEFMGFGGPDVKEGIASLRERRQPNF